jgi:hypothetical protein
MRSIKLLRDPECIGFITMKMKETCLGIFRHVTLVSPLSAIRNVATIKMHDIATPSVEIDVSPYQSHLGQSNYYFFPGQSLTAATLIY